MARDDARPELVPVTVHVDELRSPAPVLVHSFSGFLDAGSAGRLAVEHLLATREHRRVAEFDLDAVFDYRARRPRLVFERDHYATMDVPQLVLDEVVDAAEQPFLLLHGAEPDFGWRAVVAAMLGLVRRYSVRLAVGMHAIPWPAPHTRPIEVTAHATSAERLEGNAPWVGTLEVPGHLAGLLELTLGQEGFDAMGFAAHVPHYLAATDYPRPAVTLLGRVGAATGLVLPNDELVVLADKVDAEVSAQVAASEENLAAVQALEAQHDAVIAARRTQLAVPAVDAVDPESLPSGDELAAQLEQFLADLDRRHRDDH